MHGQGTFYDPRLDNAEPFPIAAEAGFGRIEHDPDLVTPKLPALLAYQLSLTPPPAPPGSFDEAMAARGEELFNGKAECATCHVPPLFSEPGHGLHSGRWVSGASRSPARGYHRPRGRFVDAHGRLLLRGRSPRWKRSSFYNVLFQLELTREIADLVEYLKSL